MNDFSSNPSYKCLGKGINITLTRWGTKNKEIREIKHQQKNQPQNNKAWACFTFFSDLEAFAVPAAASSATRTASLLSKILVRQDYQN